jgi:hypothetical protein
LIALVGYFATPKNEYEDPIKRLKKTAAQGGL